MKSGHTLEPPDLSSRAVAFFISGSDSEDNGWFGGGVDVGSVQRRVWNSALIGGSAVDAHKRKLRLRAGNCLGISLKTEHEIAFSTGFDASKV